VDRGTNASPMAALMALMNSAKEATSERIFFGALEKPYSRDVIEAKISDMAMRMYAPL